MNKEEFSKVLQRLATGKSLLSFDERVQAAKNGTAMRQHHKSRNSKPPKLRFKPGMIIREKSTKQLYCIRIIYRLISEPHEWRYYIEERNDLMTPHTQLSDLVERVVGTGMNACILHYECVRDYNDIPGVSNFYHHGDSRSGVTNKKLLNEYEIVSSGEING